MVNKLARKKNLNYLIDFLNQAIPITATVTAAMTAIGFMA